MDISERVGRNAAFLACYRASRSFHGGCVLHVGGTNRPVNDRPPSALRPTLPTGLSEKVPVWENSHVQPLSGQPAQGPGYRSVVRAARPRVAAVAPAPV